ncbi:MAG: sulfotransferase [Candidatus Marinimicrobia bacterium]|nr:sulfotransferase [Candidatus Neomarinimicrobiota bacterium]
MSCNFFNRFFKKFKQKLKLFCFTLISLPLVPPEKLCLRKYKGQTIQYSPIFIIGAPRVGSTIFYEYFTNYFNVSYINNLMDNLHQVLFSASILSEILFKNKPHDCFESSFGDTQGMNAPSESGDFWYRWLPRERHFVDFDEVGEKHKQEIGQILTAITNKFNRPLVFKNMNCGQRIRLLKEIFPGAFFIFIKRDPLYVAQSIIKTRDKLYQDRNHWWSIRPKEYDELKDLDSFEQVVQQIFFIEKQIEEDLKNYFSNNYHLFYYEEFCQNPEKIFDVVLQKYQSLTNLKIEYKKKFNLPELYLSKSNYLKDSELEKLQEVIKKVFLKG